MANKPLLSICIPTYNRAKYLKDALDSILKQINENNKYKVEICISDNASEDNTEELVEEYQKKSPIPIIYHKNEKNMGADYNYLKVVEIANGEYCWLLGSDDIIEEGGIDTVLSETEKNGDVDIFTFDRYAYSRDLKIKKIKKNYKPKIKNLESSIVFQNMYEILNHTAINFGYISVIVINRKKWLSVKGYKKWIGSAYVHVYIIYSIIKQGSIVKFVNKHLVGWRSDNDSFLNELKEYGRFKIDLYYIYIAEDVFGRNSRECDIIKKKLLYRRGFWGRIIKAKINNTSKTLYINIFKDMYPIYKYNLFFWLWYVPLMLIPSVFYRPLTNRYKR